MARLRGSRPQRRLRELRRESIEQHDVSIATRWARVTGDLRPRRRSRAPRAPAPRVGDARAQPTPRSGQRTRP
jgi:hypothetical protein